MKSAPLKYHDEHRHATWLELFFDLVFVAAIGVVIHHLAHTHHEHIPTKYLVLYVVEFVPLWWIWATHTLFANRFDTDSRGHRVASLTIMFLIVTMAAFLGVNTQGGDIAWVGLYVTVRLILAGMFITTRKRLDGTSDYSKRMAEVIVIGAAVTAISLLCDNEWKHVVFLGAVVFEMVAAMMLGRQATSVPVHREHLVERVGLLSIVMLGESVISMVAGLRDIEWSISSMIGAATGFLMIVLIWWIYFDSFSTLERAKRLTHGFVLLYSHILFCLGLGVLASLIGHVVLGDVKQYDYRLLAISGLTLFYLGKQSVYWAVFPPFRINLLINTVICISITVASSFIPQPEYALIGMTLGLLFYVYSNFRWTLTKDVSEYLIAE